jgi:hypothetical protein
MSMYDSVVMEAVLDTGADAAVAPGIILAINRLTDAAVPLETVDSGRTST